jgi:hypothetical protein
MTNTIAPVWEKKRTRETRKVEDLLSAAGFDRADAYRYNPASIRVRIIDSRFDGLSLAKRDAMVEPHIKQLPERTQGDIISLFTFSPKELEQPSKSLRESLLNREFEDPTPSML